MTIFYNYLMVHKILFFFFFFKKKKFFIFFNIYCNINNIENFFLMNIFIYFYFLSMLIFIKT